MDEARDPGHCKFPWRSARDFKFGQKGDCSGGGEFSGQFPRVAIHRFNF